MLRGKIAHHFSEKNGHWVSAGTSQWSWLMTSRLQKRVWDLELRQLLWENKRKWSGNVTDRFSESLILRGSEPFSEKRVRNPEPLQAVFGKKEFVILNGNRPLWDKRKTDLTSGCSPSPAPSPHPSAQVCARLNHALCALYSNYIIG